MVGGPDVGTILTSPVTSHMERVLVAGVLRVATPDPRAVGKRAALSGGAVDLSNAINAGSRARGSHKVAIEGTMDVPRVAQSGRHDAPYACSVKKRSSGLFCACGSASVVLRLWFPM